jgi:2',3'-cyclic-nucleotide 2'-phosphodiesterase (5'-nucleotidase family)
MTRPPTPNSRRVDRSVQTDAQAEPARPDDGTASGAFRLVVLHTNDLHGEIDALARVATLVERIRAESDCPVVYVDAGDVEETTTWISNVTSGAAMHRLLSAAGCAAAAVGNASWLRYGPAVLASHGKEASYPLLLANVRALDGSPFEGTQESALLDVDGLRLGLVGVTAPYLHFGIESYGASWVEEAPLVRRHAAELRERGADYVLLLSHLGLVDDRRLAPEVADAVDAILGAHSHDTLPEGERVGGLLVTQAGDRGRYLGRLELGPDGAREELLPVGEQVPLHPAVLAAVETIEPEVEELLGEVLGELPEPVDPETGARWFGDLLLERLDADVAIVFPGQAFTEGLPAGLITRGDLWRACDSSANPGVVTMSGPQLAAVVARGRDAEFAASSGGPFRGRPRGVLQVRGLEEVDLQRDYRVAGTDGELEGYGELVPAEWGLRPEYEFPTIVRDVFEEHFARSRV